MSRSIHDVFQESVERLLAMRDGFGAVDFYRSQDPTQHFAHKFNSTMSSLASRYTEQAYTRPQTILSRQILGGEIQTLAELRAAAEGILVMLGMSFRNREYRRQTRISPDDASGFSRISIVQPSSKIAESRLVRAEGFTDPSELVAVFRRMGRLPFQAFRRRCDFENHHGTRHGSLTYLGRLAVLGMKDDILRFQKSLGSPVLTPSAKTLREVRELLECADKHIEAWKS